MQNTANHPTGGGSPYRAVLGRVLTLAVILGILFIGGSLIKSIGGPRGENAKVYSHTEALVYYYPVCPACGHVSPLCQANLSKGEAYNTVYVCEACFQVYEIQIKR